MEKSNELGNLESNNPGGVQAQIAVPQQPAAGIPGHPRVDPTLPHSSKNKWLLPALIGVGALLLVTVGLFAYRYFAQQELSGVSKEQTQDEREETVLPELVVQEHLKPKVVTFFQRVLKSTRANVLGEQDETTKIIPVQIFAFEDHNGNGLKEPDDQEIFLMSVGIYDSPFADTPITRISSTDSGWASTQIAVGMPYQLVVLPEATEAYIPTTLPVILSETNNFATVGYQKKSSDSFRVSVYAFRDYNGDSNFNYDDPNEKPLFLAPFEFSQQKKDGSWEKLPQTISTTDTGWGTTSLDVQFPYKVRVEAGEIQSLVPANSEFITTSRNSTLVFPYISK